MFRFRSIKSSKPIFLSLKFCQITHLQDVKSFVGQYLSLNSENEKNMEKFWKKLQMLISLQFNILIP